MAAFDPQDPAFEARVRASFARQVVMTTIGARITSVGPGAVEIALPFRGDLVQQHGFLHAGIVTTIVDSSCGYAALTLMPAGVGVLSIEYKVNFMSPARGERFVARGRVIKPGRTITVCQGDVVAFRDGEDGEQLVATMLATIMTVRERPGVAD